MAFSWTCPFCQHKATITGENQSSNWHRFDNNNRYGAQTINTYAIICPNDECKEITLKASLHNWGPDAAGMYRAKEQRYAWSLIPQSSAKVFPSYVPAAIVDDYNEACSIRDLSPKASATLSRRCLQGMIRDYWGIKKDRLVDEVDSIKDKVDPVTWAAIDAVRKIGNIGAHMEKDINLVIEVDPREAGLLIGLIETLINDWYVVREERRKRMEEIVSVAADKKEQKSGGAGT